jgi:hypothetical protein
VGAGEGGKPLVLYEEFLPLLLKQHETLQPGEEIIK